MTGDLVERLRRRRQELIDIDGGPGDVSELYGEAADRLELIESESAMARQLTALEALIDGIHARLIAARGESDVMHAGLHARAVLQDAFERRPRKP